MREYRIEYYNHPDATRGGWHPGSRPEIKDETKKFKSLEQVKKYSIKRAKKLKCRYIEIRTSIDGIGRTIAEYGSGKWSYTGWVRKLKENKMKKSELRQIIKEELLKENFNPTWFYTKIRRILDEVGVKYDNKSNNPKISKANKEFWKAVVKFSKFLDSELN